MLYIFPICLCSKNSTRQDKEKINTWSLDHWDTVIIALAMERLGFESWFCHLIAVCPWVRCVMWSVLFCLFDKYLWNTHSVLRYFGTRSARMKREALLSRCLWSEGEKVIEAQYNRIIVTVKLCLLDAVRAQEKTFLKSDLSLRSFFWFLSWMRWAEADKQDLKYQD